MAQLWEEAELRGQEPPGLAQESVLFAVLHQWWFWVSADILLMLFGLYWLPRQRSNDSESDSQDGSSSSAEEEWKEDDWENEPDPYCTLGQDKSRDKSSFSAEVFLTQNCRFRKCQSLSHPVIHDYGSSGSSNIWRCLSQESHFLLPISCLVTALDCIIPDNGLIGSASTARLWEKSGNRLNEDWRVKKLEGEEKPTFDHGKNKQQESFQKRIRD
ncbi:hypothetical protein Q9966_014758 [Columba livia]|nr:hypothetical protein Q9966_014758 [Columba livia]